MGEQVHSRLVDRPAGWMGLVYLFDQVPPTYDQHHKYMHGARLMIDCGQEGRHRLMMVMATSGSGAPLHQQQLRQYLKAERGKLVFSLGSLNLLAI